MSYTGHVEPDGDWQDRADGPLLLRKLSVEDFDNNVYVVACARTRQALLIDVAARPERLAEALADREPIAAAQTHGHWDHIRAWDGVRDDLGLPVWGHPGDDELFPRPLDRELEDGEVLRSATSRWRSSTSPDTPRARSSTSSSARSVRI
jgi:glyoxylase-like metal-dependent hydrolase (beta-lactamase superfamily II)